MPRFFWSNWKLGIEVEFNEHFADKRSRVRSFQPYVFVNPSNASGATAPKVTEQTSNQKHERQSSLLIEDRSRPRSPTPPKQQTRTDWDSSSLITLIGTWGQ